MARDLQTGRATSISMSDFNARAKRIAEQTTAIEKPEKPAARARTNRNFSSRPAPREMVEPEAETETAVTPDTEVKPSA